MTDQSAFYVYKRCAKGWNYEDPEILELDVDYFREAKGFNPKNFTGFSNMIHVKVSVVKFFKKSTFRVKMVTKTKYGQLLAR